MITWAKLVGKVDLLLTSSCSHRRIEENHNDTKKAIRRNGQHDDTKKPIRGHEEKRMTIRTEHSNPTKDKGYCMTYKSK